MMSTSVKGFLIFLLPWCYAANMRTERRWSLIPTKEIGAGYVAFAFFCAAADLGIPWWQAIGIAILLLLGLLGILRGLEGA
jgi:hypothetical protein